MAKQNGSKNGNGSNGNGKSPAMGVPKTFEGRPLVLQNPKTDDERATRVAYLQHLHEELTDKEIAEIVGLSATRVSDLRNGTLQRYAAKKAAEAKAEAKAEKPKGGARKAVRKKAALKVVVPPKAAERRAAKPARKRTR